MQRGRLQEQLHLDCLVQLVLVLFKKFHTLNRLERIIVKKCLLVESGLVRFV